MPNFEKFIAKEKELCFNKIQTIFKHFTYANNFWSENIEILEFLKFCLCLVKTSQYLKMPNFWKIYRIGKRALFYRNLDYFYSFYKCQQLLEWKYRNFGIFEILPMFSQDTSVLKNAEFLKNLSHRKKNFVLITFRLFSIILHMPTTFGVKI